jgi:hypothetical protein
MERGSLMTLIRTVISNLGIIQASDSNITHESNLVRPGRKVFPLKFCTGALSLAGLYQVGDESMFAWMIRFINDYAASETPTLSGFSHRLRDALETEIGYQDMCLYHIAGYERDSEGSHPVMWFVRNVAGIANDGEYSGIGPWQVSEEFWTGHYLEPECQATLESGRYMWYVNGSAPGRVASNTATILLKTLYESMWADQDFKFRYPRTLRQMVPFIDVEMRLVGALYGSSSYEAASIGGATQSIEIPAPHDAVHLGTAKS